MPLPAKEIDRREQALLAGLHDVGLRLTHQRLEVVREIAATQTHPDVETVYQGVRERVPTISLDTVYRTLSALSETGLIDRVTATGGAARYDGNPSDHHHFVCTRCGLVRDIDDADTDTIPPTHQTDSLGEVESIQIQYRGVCTTCQQAAIAGK